MKVFIGYDSLHDDIYHVCAHSVTQRTQHVNVQPIKLSDMRDRGFTRPIDHLSSTEFSFTRFLVPMLCEYNGWALFMDSDILCQADIAELFAQADDQFAVMVVKHDYSPKSTTKMDGKIQTTYPRKNWSSVVLFNCSHPANKALTMDLVNTTTGQYLHRFTWLADDQIGEIDVEWNYLVGHNTEGNPKMIHFTEGGPWLDGYENVEFAELWMAERDDWLQHKDRHIKTLWGGIKRLFFAEHFFDGDLSYMGWTFSQQDLDFNLPIYKYLFDTDCEFYWGDHGEDLDFIRNFMDEAGFVNMKIHPMMKEKVKPSSAGSHVCVSIINNEPRFNSQIHKEHIRDVKMLRFECEKAKVVDLGDSRNFRNPSEVITKLEQLKTCSLYFGSQCSWWHIASIMNKPTIRIWPK